MALDAFGAVKGTTSGVATAASHLGVAGSAGAAFGKVADVLGGGGITAPVTGLLGAAENHYRGKDAHRKASTMQTAAARHPLLEGVEREDSHLISTILEQAAIEQKKQHLRRRKRTRLSIAATVGVGGAALASAAPIGILGLSAVALKTMAGLATAAKVADSIDHKYAQHRSKDVRRNNAKALLHHAMKDGNRTHRAALNEMGISVPSMRGLDDHQVIPIRSPQYKNAVDRLADLMSTHDPRSAS